MNFICQAIILLIASMSVTYAFTLNGSIENGRVLWDNMMTSRGQQTLTTWSSVNGLASTSKWLPGFMASPQIASTISLSSGSNSVSLPLTLNGLEYNTGSSNIVGTEPNLTSNNCNTNFATGNIIHLVGRWDCSFDSFINSDASKTPFFFIRPLINVDNREVLERFQGKPEGRYSGMMPVTTRYFYYSSSGGFTYRDIRMTFYVHINHKPSYISSLTVTGSGVINPVYDTHSKSVSGSTTFDLSAIGYFDKGLKMFIPNRNYSLKNQSSNSVIPYNISCAGSGCATRLVTNGLLVTPDLILTPSTDKTTVNFKLDVAYDQPGKDLATGRYTDSFNVIFETDF